MNNSIFNIVDSRFGTFNQNGMFEIKDILEMINEITFNSYGNLYIKQGKKNILLIETDKSNLANIHVATNNNKLDIETKVKSNSLISIFKPAAKLNFYLTLKELQRINMNGSGDTYIQDELNTESIHIDINASGNFKADSIRSENFIFHSDGSGDLNISKLKASRKSGMIIRSSGNADIKNYETKEIIIEINGRGDVTFKNIDTTDIVALLNGSGNLKISGRTMTQSIKSTSSGDYNAKKLDSNVADVNLLGSGDVRIKTDDKVTVNKKGSGDLKIEGKPEIDSIN